MDQIGQIKAGVQRASGALLKTFEFVPDDKLTWSPSDTARSALWIVGHCGRANKAFAQGIRGEAFQAMSTEEFGQMVWNAGREITSRQEAVRLVEESTAELMTALDGLTPERIGGMVQTPFGPMPMAFWVSIPEGHMMGHGFQVEYLQTIWGDQQNHMM